MKSVAPIAVPRHREFQGRWTAEFAPGTKVESIRRIGLPTPLPARRVEQSGVAVDEYPQLTRDWRFWDLARFFGRIGSRLLWLRITKRPWRPAVQRYAVLELHRMGGLWQEFGAMLAFHPGLAQAMDWPANIRVNRTQMTREQINAEFTRDFGISLDEAFSSFDPLPDVVQGFYEEHHATLRSTGQLVEVRVRRPATMSILRRDARLVSLLARTGATFGMEHEIIMPRMAQEVKDRLVQIADLRFAVSGLDSLKGAIHKHHGFVPEPILDFCSRRFLVTQLIDAPTLADWAEYHRQDPDAALAWLRVNNIEPERLGRRIADFFLSHLLERDVFRSDLSPDNIQLLRDSGFALKPTPRFASIDRQYQRTLAEMFRALAARDYSKASDYLLLLCDKVPKHRLNHIQSELVRLHRSFDAHLDLQRTKFSERSYAHLSLEMTVLLQRHGVTRNSQTVVIGQAWMKFEETIQLLMPNFHLREELERYFEHADERKLSKLKKQGLKRTVSDVMNSVSEQWGFLGSQLRRRSQALTSLNKTAYAIGLLLRNLRRVFVYTMSVGLLAHLRILNIIPGFEQSRIGRWSEGVQAWRLEELLMAGLITIVAFRLAIRWMSQMEDVSDSQKS